MELKASNNTHSSEDIHSIRNYGHQAVKTIHYNIITPLQILYPSNPNMNQKSLHTFNYREAERKLLLPPHSNQMANGALFFQLMHRMHKPDVEKFPQGIHVDFF